MNRRRHRFLKHIAMIYVMCIAACGMAAASTCTIGFPLKANNHIDAAALKAGLTSGSEYVESFECEPLNCTTNGLSLFTIDKFCPSGLVINMTDEARGYIKNVRIAGSGSGILSVNHLDREVSGSFNENFALNDTVSSLYLSCDQSSVYIKTITLDAETCAPDRPERPWASFGPIFRYYSGKIESAPLLPVYITSPGADRIIVFADTYATFTFEGESAVLYPAQGIKYYLVGENSVGQSPVTSVSLAMTDGIYPRHLPIEPVTDAGGIVEGARYVLYIPDDAYFAKNATNSTSSGVIQYTWGDRYIANQVYRDNTLVVIPHKADGGKWTWTTDNLNGASAAFSSDGKGGFRFSGSATPSTVTFADGRAKIDFGNGWICSDLSKRTFRTTTVADDGLRLPVLYRLKSVDAAVSAGTVVCRDGQIEETELDGRTYLTMHPVIDLTRTMDDAAYHLMVSGIDCGDIDNPDLTLAPACLTTSIYVAAVRNGIPVAISRYNASTDSGNPDKYPTPWESIRRTKLVTPTAENCRLIYDAASRSVTAYVPLRFDTGYPCGARIINSGDKGRIEVDSEGLSWYRLDGFIDNVEAEADGSVRVATTRLVTKVTPVIPIAFTTSEDQLSRAASYRTGGIEWSQFPIDIELGQDQVSSSDDITAVNTDMTDTPAEYYTLDGCRVAEPVSAGIYIRRAGLSISKIIVRP